MDGRRLAIQHLVCVTLEVMSDRYIELIDNIEKIREEDLVHIADLMAEGKEINGFLKTINI